MLIHHSLRNSNRGASGRPSDGFDVEKPTSVLPTARSSSPLKFFTHKQSDVPEPADSQKAQKRWTADYLTELRKPSVSRPNGARPMGARPPPGRASTAPLDLPLRATSALGTERLDENTLTEPAKRSVSPFKLPRASMTLDGRKNAGRPLAREPDTAIMEDIARTTAKLDNLKVDIDGRKSPMPYYERGQRWMERQEARSLRAAMDLMDSEKGAKDGQTREEDRQIHAAAQQEAAELVWKHRFVDKPYENPDALKHTIKDHLRKGSHAKSQSVGPFETLYVTKGGVKDGRRSASDGSDSSNSDTSKDSHDSRVVSMSSKAGNDSNGSADSRRRYGGLALVRPAAKLFGSRRLSRKSRTSSGGKQSGVFNNPQDRIYEEPEDMSEAPPDIHVEANVLNPKSRNISGTYRSSEEKHDFDTKTPLVPDNKLSSVDVNRNIPFQLHGPSSEGNDRFGSVTALELVEEQPAMKDGREIRGDDIRAATSMKLKDRSPNLPKPTYVSDSPGRPIVSFDYGYQPSDSSRQLSSVQSSSAFGSRSRGSGSNPTHGPLRTPVPTINTPEATPSIKLPDELNQPSRISIPSISLPKEPSSNTSMPTINLPLTDTTIVSDPSGKSGRSGHQSHQIRGHWSPAAPRSAGASCNTCGRHIAGRTLSAAGERYHPECFNCSACGTNLEHVAFYPEPEDARQERLACESGASTPGSLDARFYCHLDFHENFSPRCKSCKTPIEGEVILACGSHWHQGHFFCAQCGDPFDGEKPFIEKDGWAWCVGCYKGRYSGKCRGCKKPVIEDGVMAMGAEWHADCFRCTECSGPFEDGRFFTRGEGTGPVCVQCEERRLKS